MLRQADYGAMEVSINRHPKPRVVGRANRSGAFRDGSHDPPKRPRQKRSLLDYTNFNGEGYLNRGKPWNTMKLGAEPLYIRTAGESGIFSRWWRMAIPDRDNTSLGRHMPRGVFLQIKIRGKLRRLRFSAYEKYVTVLAGVLRT